MFSPSLVSMILHSLWHDSPEADFPTDLESHGDVVRALSHLSSRFQSERWPQVPVSASAVDPGPATESFGDYIRISEPERNREDNPQSAQRSERYFWGRVPVDRLIRYYEQWSKKPAVEEYLDLAGSVGTQAVSSLTAPVGTHAARIASLLARTEASASAAAVRLGIIDLGREVTDPALLTYSGRLRMARAGALDPHAEQVLLTLLDRLDQNNVLHRCHVSCALVKPRNVPIGRKCFDGFTAVELQDALQDLYSLLEGEPGPIVTNLSMGNHIGPHNGLSPFERHASRLASPPDRFLLAAAGNDGGSGLAGRIELAPDTEGTLTVRLGGTRCSEVLVEFWWTLAGGYSSAEEYDGFRPPKSTRDGILLGIEVSGRTLDGLEMDFAPLRLDSTRPATLQRHYSDEEVVCLSLFNDNCCGEMGCIAFAASSPNKKPLPACKLTFTLLSPRRTTVNAWIAECGNDAAFVEGGEKGNIRAPATAKNVVCIAGVKDNQQPWPESSRGPSYDYSLTCYCGNAHCSYPRDALSRSIGYNDDITLPHIAHQVAVSFGSPGTSFACPRAAGDAARVLIEPGSHQRCTSARELAIEILRSQGRKEEPWNPRTGFGRI
jgi:Subtilase family